MAEVEKQEGQKTVVSFIVGLLIGGLLVWAFSSPVTDDNTKTDKADDKEQTDKADDKDDEDNKDKDDEKADDSKSETKADTSVKSEIKVEKLVVGEGKVVVNNQTASKAIKMEGVTYPVKEGWIGVRDYADEQVGRILGVVRFSESQGLVPSEIILQTPTIAGKEYAVVVFHEDGDRQFDPAHDRQIDTVFATFKAE